jgi:DNA polymerase IV
MMSARTPAARLCCLDLDTFFVSVERLLDPSLVGKPVVVGGKRGQRGVVTAASYEVRAFGVRSGMSMVDAERKAPHAVFLPTRHGVYGPYSRKVKEILERACPAVQTASIDEYYMDWFGCERMLRQIGDRDDDAAVLRTVRALRQRIQDELGLPASVGIGATIPIAKMASRDAKPAGVYMVPLGQERAYVYDMPARAFPGIGPVAERRLASAGLHTMGQLLDLSGPLLQRFQGAACAVRQGIDPARVQGLGRDRPAFREHDPVGVDVGSISNERTFMQDAQDPGSVQAQLRALSERVAWRARGRGILARTVTLKLRWSDFETITRARTVPPTHDEHAIHQVILELYRQACGRKRRSVRLVGVALSNLVTPTQQLALPFEDPSRPAAGDAIDAVRHRFGYDAIRLGSVGKGKSWVA